MNTPLTRCLHTMCTFSHHYSSPSLTTTTVLLSPCRLVHPLHRSLFVLTFHPLSFIIPPPHSLWMMLSSPTTHHLAAACIVLLLLSLLALCCCCNTNTHLSSSLMFVASFTCVTSSLIHSSPSHLISHVGSSSDTPSPSYTISVVDVHHSSLHSIVHIRSRSFTHSLIHSLTHSLSHRKCLSH